MVALWHSLTIFVLLCTAFVDGTSSEDNLARGKETYQSSTLNSQGNSSNAVDGGRNSNYHNGSCTLTERVSEQYWYVDLGARYRISEVVIHNRMDCCWERLQNTEVYVVPKKPTSWNVDSQYLLCGEILEVDRQIEIRVQCGGHQGRFVFIRKRDSGALTLCEVEVLKQENLARGKNTHQTSTSNNGHPDLAVDGNTNSNFDDGSCTLTSYFQNGKFTNWRVYLGKEYWISEVVIFNRMDCCSEWLNNTDVYVDVDKSSTSHHCGKIVLSSPDDSPITIRCDRARGDIVKIRKKYVPAEPLSLCEVEVYEWQNLAQGKSTSQSLTHVRSSSNAVDGDINTSSNTKSSNPYWNVFLGADYIISEIVTYSPIFSTQYTVYVIPNATRISNFIENPIAFRCNRSSHGYLNYNFFECGGLRGQIVSIQGLNSESLSLNEVAVYN